MSFLGIYAKFLELSAGNGAAAQLSNNCSNFRAAAVLRTAPARPAVPAIVQFSAIGIEFGVWARARKGANLDWPVRFASQSKSP